MTLQKITEFYTKQFSICPSITSKCQTTTIFKISFKENNDDSNKTSMYIPDLSVFRTSYVLSAIVYEFSP
jgi:hypothetical protein